MDLVDESFVADLDEETPKPEEPTSKAEGDDAKPETPGEGTTPEAAAEGDEDDDPEEYKELKRSKFANLQTDKEVKAALAKSYRELANDNGRARRDDSALLAKIDRLEKLVEQGRTQERPAEETSPELQAIDEDIQSLKTDGQRAIARIQEIESGWTKRERDIAKLEVKLESADDLDKGHIRGELRDAQREHDALIKERSEKYKDIEGLKRQLTKKDAEFKRAERSLEDERERQRQAEAEQEDRNDQTREQFDAYLGTLANTHKIPESERNEFASLVNARVVLDLKNRPVGPALNLKRLADHYAGKYAAHVDRMVKVRMREATSPKTPPGTTTARPSVRPSVRPAPPQSREAMLRAEEERKAKARDGLEEYFSKKARVRVS